MTTGTDAEQQHVLDLISAGAYWDELTEEEKDAYCKYRGFDLEGREKLLEVYAEATGKELAEVQHEQLEKKPTLEEQKAMREDVERWMQEEVERYNSPEEVAKRKAEYEEIQRIGKLRMQDFYSGRDMDKCHLLE